MIPIPPTGSETTMSVWLWLLFLLLIGIGTGPNPIDPAQENPIRSPQKAITPIAWVTPG